MSRTSVASATAVPKPPDAAEPITFEEVAHALQDLADLVHDLAELGDEIRLRHGTVLHLGDTIRALSERCHARHEETEG